MVKSGRKPSERIPAFDGVRGLAILLVMVYHAFLPHFVGEIQVNGVGRVLVALTRTGWAGVDLFFVLSGFLISGILLDAKGNERYFRNFYARRTLRIFPLSFLFLALCFIVLPAVGGEAFSAQREYARNQAWFWAYLSNNFMAVTGWPQGGVIGGHMWSLAIEEQFYVFWPLLVFLVSTRSLIRVCLALLLAAFCSRALSFWTPYGATGAFLFTPCRLDGLAAGALVAAVVRHENPRRFLASGRWICLLSTLGIVGLYLGCHGFRLDNKVIMTFGISAFSICFASNLYLVAVQRHHAAVHRMLRSRFLVFLGTYSYGLYVFHSPILGIWKGLNMPLRLGLHSQFAVLTVSVLAPLAATLGVTLLSWFLYEKPMLSLKRYFPSSRARMEKEVPAVAAEPGS